MKLSYPLCVASNLNHMREKIVNFKNISELILIYNGNSRVLGLYVFNVVLQLHKKSGTLENASLNRESRKNYNVCHQLLYIFTNTV